MNETHGGIHGVPVKLLWADNKYQVPLALNFYRRWKEKGILCHNTYISGAEVALKDTYAKDKIPCIPSTYAPNQIDPPGWIFNPLCSYADGLAGAGRWFMEQWKKKGETRRVRLCIIYPDNTYGRAPLKAKKFLKHIGIDVVGEFVVPWNPVDTVASMYGAMAKKPDFIYLQHHAGGAAVIFRDMRKAGLLPKTPVIGGWYIMDNTTLKLAPVEGEGVMAVCPYGLPTENTPAVKILVDWHEKKHGTRELESYVYYYPSYIFGILSCEAIKRAYEKVGWPVTGQDVYNALVSLKDYDMGGLTDNISFTGTGPKSRRGSSSIRIIRIHDSKIEPLSDWFSVPLIKVDGSWID